MGRVLSPESWTKQMTRRQSSAAQALFITALKITTSPHKSEADSNKLRIWHRLLNPDLQLPTCVTLDSYRTSLTPILPVCGQTDPCLMGGLFVKGLAPGRHS